MVWLVVFESGEIDYGIADREVPWLPGTAASENIE
jgi:hypothetical protein